MRVLGCFYLSSAKCEFVPTEAHGLSLVEACVQQGSLSISFRTVFSSQDVILHLKFYLLSVSRLVSFLQNSLSSWLLRASNQLLKSSNITGVLCCSVFSRSVVKVLK